MGLPILYSLRQCPYAMRARLGLLLAHQPVILRDIVMSNIPKEMILASPKSEVPVLVFDGSSAIDESLDIMIWAFKNSDPNNLLYSHQPNACEEMLTIIHRSIKPLLVITIMMKYFIGRNVKFLLSILKRN